MKTSFLRRQSTWVGILLTGLIGIAAFLIFSTDKFKATDYLPYLKTNKAATNYNLGFEKVSNLAKLPDDWFKWGYPSYEIKIDSVVKHSGKYALRVEPKGEVKGVEFGCPAFAIPAKYAGKTITVKAFMRTEGVDQPIGLLLRIDKRSGGSLEFDNMQQRGITGSENWEEYSVTLPLSQRAETIYIGALLSGKGKLWVDDFQVLIDGVDLQFAKLKSESPYKADTDLEFANSSKITIKEYTPQTVANLELLGRVWGFLKYYHPAVAAGEYNWDAELFRVMPSIINAKSIDERNEIFVQWIDRLGKVKRDRSKNKETVEVKMLPDLAWIENPDLGEALSKRLEMVKNARRTPDNYYVSYVMGNKYPNFMSEKEYEKMSFYDDSGMRLLGLFRCWNMVQYFYPYRYLAEKEWNTALGEFIPKFLDGFTKLDYKQSVADLMNRLNEPKTYLWNAMWLDDQDYGRGNLALYKIAILDGRPVVSGYPDKDKLQSSGLKIGDMIVNVNHQPVEEIKHPTFQVLNSSFVAVTGIAFLHTPKQKLTVGVIRDGKPLTCDINCFSIEKYDRDFPSFLSMASYKYLSSDIGYIQPGAFNIDSLSGVLKSFGSTKGLVIDLRCLMRDDSIASSIADYLLPKPVAFAKLTKADITQPGKFIFTTLKAGKENPDYYKGKVVVLVNEATAGFAELNAMAFQAVPHAMVIGSATSCSAGNGLTIPLPGEISTGIPGIGVYYPDGRETQRAGIKLDLEVKQTIKGIIEGRDELLEKAVEIIHK